MKSLTALIISMSLMSDFSCVLVDSDILDVLDDCDVCGKTLKTVMSVKFAMIATRYVREHDGRDTYNDTNVIHFIIPSVQGQRTRESKIPLH